MKQFVPVRIDIHSMRTYCHGCLSFLNLDSSSIIKILLQNLLSDSSNESVNRFIEICVGYEKYTEYKNVIEQTIDYLSQEAIVKLSCILPCVSLQHTKIVLVTDGDMDCIAYVELNDQTSKIIPAEYHSRTIDEGALNYLG